MNKRSDEGSIMPLAIGCTGIALVLVIIVVIISDMYLAHKRLVAIADSAALAASDTFDPLYGGEPAITLTDAAVVDAARDYLREANASHGFDTLIVTEPTGSPDARSARVTLRATVAPVLIAPFLPDGIELNATATARGSLRLGD